MKKLLYIFLLTTCTCFSQNEEKRIQTIQNQLELLTGEISGLSEQAKTEISVHNITLPNFILAISNTHGININVAPELRNITISNNNFSGVRVIDLLVFLCKEYQLTIEFTGSILSIKKYVTPVEVPKEIPAYIAYQPENNSISIDAKNHTLYSVFKTIMDKSAKNLVFAPGLENKSITFYVKNTPFEAALDKLALANNLYVHKTKDDFYVFEEETLGNSNQKNARRRKGQSDIYKLIDVDRKLLEVNFNKTSIETIIKEIGEELNLNIFTATPLEKAGSVTFKAKNISFDELLIKIFESQMKSSTQLMGSVNDNNSNRDPRQSVSQPISSSENFIFKKEGDIYYFGTENQLSVRKVEVIHLMHRSVELLSDPSGGGVSSRTVGRNNYNSNSYNNSYNNSYSQNYNSQSRNNLTLNNNRTSLSNSSYHGNTSSSSAPSKTIEEIIPAEISESLEIKVDHELNSLYVTGSSTKIERLKKFIEYIDKTVPVVLIEVMFVEVNKINKVETGVSWAIGEEPKKTSGKLFPQTDLTLGAQTINKVINGFNGFDRLNLGKVVPNFFATVKAMEKNGNLKIKSTPKLSTLNGHRATFSNGETSYYTVTQRNIYGTDNPQTSEITNYEPIDAELGITIKPLVSGDGQVTLDIFVIQSSFGSRIDKNAPPDISSKEFSSIIRVQNQDIVVLGGLEKQVKDDSGDGVPLLARIPVIKWLFSSRKREDSKTKLTVFIKPTIIY
ncbi:general secretion pathway protein GspD [Wenyingzhuangia sp. chi5]|uniref:General secretion pathway protein GspD n=1 Tax=Wenyingzhuangia gilva TaxID=3057677 RepID=A0ABT8VV81_9FLAO|nr:general secretion pathway protein GspD [Wenyingzhuangia sp. chi5]MDO3695883.1 general secretion pathway protein GspD [Wenyingzhuangia sp. chi5]